MEEEQKEVISIHFLSVHLKHEPESPLSREAASPGQVTRQIDRETDR